MRPGRGRGCRTLNIRYGIGWGLPSIPYPPTSQKVLCNSAEFMPIYQLISGVDQGIVVRGGLNFFFKGMGSRGRLKTPRGSRATPLCGPRGRSPGNSWILVILGVKFNHKVLIDEVTPSLKRRNAPLSTHCHQIFFSNLIYFFIIELWFEFSCRSVALLS